jgi:(4S)-4-hydroxy-5-phosphonooxypentane-2,3-dione isomerase
MIVRTIQIQVKPERAAEFVAATLENHRGSLGEPGVLRFDVLQSVEDPASFLLYEVYRDEAATQAHKLTAHYEAWRLAVEPLMAGPRKGLAFKALAPTDPQAW